MYKLRFQSANLGKSRILLDERCPRDKPTVLFYFFRINGLGDSLAHRISEVDLQETVHQRKIFGLIKYSEFFIMRDASSWILVKERGNEKGHFVCLISDLLDYWEETTGEYCEYELHCLLKDLIANLLISEETFEFC